MTKREALINHRKMWNWIAEESVARGTVVSKTDYLVENGQTFPRNCCYCCEYAGSISGGMYICSNCPVSWGEGVDACICEGSPYKVYGYINDRLRSGIAVDHYELSAYVDAARKIANLQERVDE